MNRTLSRLCLSLLLLSLSSCLWNRPASDADTDEALGLSSASNTSTAQQEIERLQQEQLKEQKRQIDRQITDPIHPVNS